MSRQDESGDEETMWDRAQRSAAEHRREAPRSWASRGAEEDEIAPGPGSKLFSDSHGKPCEFSPGRWPGSKLSSDSCGKPHEFARDQAYAAARAQRDAAVRNIWVGALICAAGIVVTALSYSAAAGGGRYVVAWGAVIFGAIRTVKGLAGLRSATAPSDEL